MKGVKVKTYTDVYGPWTQGDDAIITGGICYSEPFICDVESFIDNDGAFQEWKPLELIKIHFYNGSALVVSESDFEKVVTVTNNRKHTDS